MGKQIRVRGFMRKIPGSRRKIRIAGQLRKKPRLTKKGRKLVRGIKKRFKLTRKITPFESLRRR